MVREGFVPVLYNPGGYSGYSHWGSVSVSVLSAATLVREAAAAAPPEHRNATGRFRAATCGRERSRPARRRHGSARATALCGCGGTGGTRCTGLRRLGRLQWRRLALGAGLAEPVRGHLCNHQQSDTHKSDSILLCTICASHPCLYSEHPMVVPPSIHAIHCPSTHVSTLHTPLHALRISPVSILRAPHGGTPIELTCEYSARISRRTEPRGG
jgi:hypothetical protein